VDADFGGGMVGCSPMHRHLALGRHACHKEFQRQQGRGVVPRCRHLALKLSCLGAKARPAHQGSANYSNGYAQPRAWGQ